MIYMFYSCKILLILSLLKLTFEHEKFADSWKYLSVGTWRL